MDYTTNKDYNNLLNKLPADTELHPMDPDFIDAEYLTDKYNYILFDLYIFLYTQIFDLQTLGDISVQNTVCPRPLVFGLKKHDPVR